MKSSNLPFPGMPQSPQTPGAGSLWRRWGGWIIGVVVLAALAAFIWYMLAGTASTRREVAATPMLMLPPEPVKPPEPEKLPDPPPEKVKPEIQEPKPSPVDTPKDQAPSPDKAVGDPLTMNAEAQAGVGGILAGGGGGMVGGGGMAGSYANYVSNAMQQALVRDPRTRSEAFEDTEIDVWLDTSGKVVRVVKVRGKPGKVDELVLAVLRDFRTDERPSPTVRFPIHAVIKGRRPS